MQDSYISDMLYVIFLLDDADCYFSGAAWIAVAPYGPYNVNMVGIAMETIYSEHSLYLTTLITILLAYRVL